MSNGNPVVAIRNWFLGQPDVIRHEIAIQIAYPMLDVSPIIIADPKRSTELVADWLDDTIARKLQLGRVLSFCAAMDYGLRGRDSEEGWDEAEKMARRLVEAMKDEPELNPEGMLDTLPERRAQWIAVAADWRKLRDAIFSGRNLEAWAFRG